MPVQLPHDYYLRNFRELLGFVAERYWALLNPAERHFYHSFEASTEPAQRLYIRLVSRRGPLFRARRLRYPEIACLDTAAAELAAAGLLAIDPLPAPADLLRLFSKAELAAGLGQPGLARLPRAALEQHLLDQQASAVAALGRREPLWQVLAADCVDTFRLCFFGNLRQDLSEFVLSELGLQHYENYPLDPVHLPFHSRAQIEQHLAYYRCLSTAEQALQGGAAELVELWRSLPRPAADDAPLRRRVQRLTNTLARQLERLELPELALTLYRSAERPPARERSARILAARGEIGPALTLCSEMAAHPVNEEERAFAASFGPRLARKLGRRHRATPPYHPPERQLLLAPGDLPVELAAARALSERGRCFYVENRLFCGILGLLLWDIVFAPVPGAFYNPFQQAPADFYEPEFLTARHDLLSERLRASEDPAAMASWVLGHWSVKYGLRNPLVHWDSLSEELLVLALARIPAQHWQRLLARLLQDLRHHRSGLPDLIAFPEDGGYALLEVKAPGDRLQQHQRRWMAHFADAGIPHEVLHIQWRDP